MRKFWKFAWIPPTVILLVLAILFIVWRPADDDAEEDDDENVGVFYLDSTVADDDERISTSYVNNSGNNFFLTGKALRYELQTERQTGLTEYRSFIDAVREHTEHSSFQPMTAEALPAAREICVTEAYSGQSSDGAAFSVAAGERLRYLDIVRKDKAYYYRVGDRLLPVQNAVRICRRDNFNGTAAHPFAVDVDVGQQLEFTGRGDYIYMYFTPDNEFISLFLSGLPSGSSWEMFDRNYRKVGGEYIGQGGSAEIYRRGKQAQYYLLRVTSGGKATVSMGFRRDQNEWRKNMVDVKVGKTYSGVFDYYGDEDFYVVEDDLIQGDALAMQLSGVDAELQVLVYDRDKNLIGRYTRPRGISEEIVLYGMNGIYAVSVRTVDGKTSGGKYTVGFHYMNVYLLGVETYGFKIAEPIDVGENGENYYTATCTGLSGKRISDVQTAGRCTVKMTLTTAQGVVYNVREGNELPLHVGKNILKIEIKNATSERTLQISIIDTESYTLGDVFAVKNTAVKAGPSDSSSTVATLSSGERAQNCGETENGYCKVELPDGNAGWVSTGTVFIDYKKCAMPSEYASAVKKLQRSHPNWKFTFVDVGESFTEAMSAELAQAPIIESYGGWKRASSAQVSYYMDPGNFLNEQDIFMFEKQTYHPGTYTKNGVLAVWKQRAGALASAEYYADCFMEAGKTAGLSPYFIASRAAIESGGGTSRLAKGESEGYEGYYNFYGIGAVDSNPKQGAAVAKNNGWNTQRIAIVEGAVWMRSQYVAAQQYTPYFFKYSFVPGRKWHQYMTAVAAPLEDARQLYKAHASGGTLNSAIEFVIPVFK